MKSFIDLVLRLNLNCLSVLIILDEYWGIADKCTLNRAAKLFPGLLFVVELENYDKHDNFVNVDSDVTLLFQSLQISCATWCINFQGHIPPANAKLILSWNIYIVWWGYDQVRGIFQTKPERSARQVKQGAFTFAPVTFH